MQSIKNDTIGAFNAYVEALAKDAPESRLSLTIFDSQSIDTIVNDVKAGEVKALTADSYQPRASTPLYDAIGKVVDLLASAKGKNKVLVILTDGHENASREFTRDAVRKLLDEKQEKDNWLVLYLGANQDAFAVGAGIGVQGATAMDFAASGSGMRGTMAAASASTLRYASTSNRLDASFTTDERAKAAK
jgi:hypothetical protein